MLFLFLSASLAFSSSSNGLSLSYCLIKTGLCKTCGLLSASYDSLSPFSSSTLAWFYVFFCWIKVSYLGVGTDDRAWIYCCLCCWGMSYILTSTVGFTNYSLISIYCSYSCSLALRMANNLALRLLVSTCSTFTSDCLSSFCFSLDLERSLAV